MAEEILSTEEIERSLSGTRRRIENRFSELSRRVQSRADAVPDWALGAGAAALLYLLRRPLLRALRSVAQLSAPVVVPLVIGKLMERRQTRRTYRALAESGAFGSEGARFGEAARSDGPDWRDPSYSP